MSTSENTKSSKVLPAFSLLLLTVLGILGVKLSTGQDVVKDPALVPGDVAWMLTASALVLLMTPGLSFFYGGMVNSKNVISTMLQSFISMGVISIVWILFGFSLAFGKSINGIIGDPGTFFMLNGVGSLTDAALSPTIPLALFALFQLKFAIITPALITGSFAERIRFSSYIIFLILWSVLVYAPLAHMTWHPEGLFRVWGALDFAGGTVVHLSAGFAALAGAMYLGPRRKPSNNEVSTPANIPYVILGTGMLWFGWFGFNAGSALAANEFAVNAFLTTNTACASAMLAWLLADALAGKKPSALGACIGAVVGLVAITPAAGYVNVGASILIGVIGSLVSNYAVNLRSKSKLDDTLDVFPCHGMGGITGMILTAVFAAKVGLIFGESTTFLNQILALVIAAVYTFVMSLILFKLTDIIIPIRVTDEQEKMGLDMSQHGESV